ncbi:MAG: CehA/McbA family metallohydrolase [Armatimonadota bacterium]|nr:CehA/McbA family metallohydrolase [Armatimonadota bacterium]
MSAMEATLLGPDRVRAGGQTRVELRLRMREPLEAGASIRLRVPLGWTPPSLEGGAGLTRWHVAGRALVLGEVVRRRHLQLNVTGGRLRPGDEIVVTYGAGPEGATVQPWVTDAPCAFEVEVCRHNERRYGPGGSIPIAVDPGPPAYLHVVAPSGARPGIEVAIRVRVLDAFGNLCQACETDALVAGMHSLRVQRGCGEVHVPFPTAGVYRVDVALRDPDLSGRSNPCRVARDAPAIWWGDPHVHTTLSDGVASPDFALAYGRDVACLDFTAITDHDVEYHHAWFTRRCQRLTDEAWAALAETIGRYRTGGRFAVLRGYEWTGRPYGDRCVYLWSDGSAICRYEPNDAATPAELWQTLRRRAPHQALVVPHTPASGFMGTDWTEHDDELEPLVEIYSMHGASECAGGPAEMIGAVPGRYVRDALARGYRMGFVAGGDMHSSQPGNPVLAVGPYRTLRFKPGLTAVVADRLDERAILDAMRDRRTYATTGARILLQFSVNGVPLGGQLALGADGPVVVHGTIHGTAALAEVAVVRDGAPAYVARPLQEDAEIRWEDPAPVGGGGGSYYYLRAIQVDGEVAWSSPVWVNRP